ncbi:phage head closure protein [Rhizobium sp. YIM 134829]|uniref:phage head closure protein n=1 Tax=Rhizobium sp. YIM 134829 TaxID=3390453 RepID=UPI00397CBEAE
MSGVLDPGLMTARLDLETFTETADGQGGVTRSAVLVATLWARIEPLMVATGERQDERLSEASHRIDLRYRTDLRAGMRLRKGTRIFEILAVHDPDETGRLSSCRCRELLP